MRFLLLAILLNLKKALALRSALLLTIVIIILKQSLFLTGWYFFFERYQSIHGWTMAHMLAMYGVAFFSIGFVELFFYGIKELPKTIYSGQLDVFMLQPKNIILNLALSRGEISAIGEIVMSLILLGYSGYLSSHFLVLLLILPIGALFNFSLCLYLGSLAFFIEDAGDFIKEVYLNAVIIQTQPNSAYKGALKLFTMTVLPVAFLSFFPIEYLRTGSSYALAFSTLGTLLFFMVACLLFQTGLKRYKSGSAITLKS